MENSQLSHVNHPLIFHMDMDAYFASVEQQANPHLRGKAIGVSGKPDTRTVIVAASKEAKRKGVKTAMTIYEAKKICPQIQLVSGDPIKYQHIAKMLVQICQTYSPKVEVFSIDEMFIDVTHQTEKYPSIQDLALQIKQDVKDQIGHYVTCSIGIAHNKLLAKLASDINKPDGITDLTQPQIIANTLAHTPLTDFCGIGPRMQIRLNNYGIKTVGELKSIPQQTLQELFGKYGLFLFDLARGQGNVEFITNRMQSAEKSLGHSTTLPTNTNDLETLHTTWLALCEKVVSRMQQKQLTGKTVHVWLRFGDFTHSAKQTTTYRPIMLSQDLFNISWPIVSYLQAQKPVRALGVSVSNLTPNIQYPLFLKERKHFKISLALQTVEARFGKRTIVNARTLNQNLGNKVAGFYPKETWTL